MPNIFDDMKHGKDTAETEQTELNSIITDEHIITARKPEDRDVLEVCLVTTETAEPDGLLRSTSHDVFEAACCGSFLSYDSHTGHERPGGKCQNEECRALLCSNHVKFTKCAICNKTLCVVCRRVAGGHTFCEEHYETHARKSFESEVKQCVDTNPTQDIHPKKPH